MRPETGKEVPRRPEAKRRVAAMMATLTSPSRSHMIHAGSRSAPTLRSALRLRTAPSTTPATSSRPMITVRLLYPVLGPTSGR